MKFAVPKMAGSAQRSGPDAMTFLRLAIVSLALQLASADGVTAQDLYKYQDKDGNWIYADKPPDDGRSAEKSELTRTITEGPIIVDVTDRFDNDNVLLTARNDYFAPVEIRLEIVESRDLELPPESHPMTWVLPPRSETHLLQLYLLEGATRPMLEYRFRYMPGDPRATHEPAQPYRVPFAIASNHPISQAYPDARTHTTPDSQYAVDIAMPIGTDVVAAREGTVIEIAASNFRSGLNVVEDGPAANVVRILHDDGTIGIYAHLNTNTIRVKPGDFVERGQYIADSGNTGFSSGPHLHFAVVQNVGLSLRSVPVEFQGSTSEPVVPTSGNVITAY